MTRLARMRTVAPDLLEALRLIELSARRYRDGFVDKAMLLAILRRHGQLASGALALVDGGAA